MKAVANFKQAHAGNYRKGRSGSIQYIVVHYTANRGDTAKNNADYFARAVTETSAHYFVDEKEVWQSVKDTETAYHCGRSDGKYKHPKCRNANSLGVEMCDAVGGVKDAVRANTVALVKELMEKYGVPVENVVRHYDVTGKNCPAPWVADENAWQEFKSMLAESEDDEMTIYHWFKDMPDWARPSAEKAYQKGIIKADESGAVNVYEANLQPLVWLDRLGLL